MKTKELVELLLELIPNVSSRQEKQLDEIIKRLEEYDEFVEVGKKVFKSLKR